jgi:hypothetical protein
MLYLKRSSESKGVNNINTNKDGKSQGCQFLGAKSTSILDCVGPSVGPSVGRSVRPPRCAITWKTRVTSRLLREEEEEEKTDYVAIPLRRDSFAPRD